MDETKKNRLEALFADYRLSLIGRVEELDLAWQSLQVGWQADIAREFDRSVHSMAGSSRTFDCAEVGEKARELENTFKPLLPNAGVNDEQRAVISQLLVELRECVLAAQSATN